jgi:hypothetical protein
MFLRTGLWILAQNSVPELAMPDLIDLNPWVSLIRDQLIRRWTRKTTLEKGLKELKNVRHKLAFWARCKKMFQ